MAPSFKEQIKDLKYHLSSQDIVIAELKKDRESAASSLFALFQGIALVSSRMAQWDQLDSASIVDLSDMPDLTKINHRNYPMLADLGLQVLSVAVRVMGKAEKDLTEIEDELKIIIPSVPTTWAPAEPEIPSPLTRALALIEAALDETPDWKQERASRLSSSAISEAETLIHAMESAMKDHSGLSEGHPSTGTHIPTKILLEANMQDHNETKSDQDKEARLTDTAKSPPPLKTLPKPSTPISTKSKNGSKSSKDASGKKSAPAKK